LGVGGWGYALEIGGWGYALGFGGSVLGSFVFFTLSI
jgi:hypothetical protein